MQVLELERKTREALADLLAECGELADGVRYFDHAELVELLDTLDSIRALLADNATTLRAAISEGGLRYRDE
jgi:NTP pyrophosphatase (non-canonical NTP hydrolase)